jgi:hypothetical protein
MILPILWVRKKRKLRWRLIGMECLQCGYDPRAAPWPFRDWAVGGAGSSHIIPKYLTCGDGVAHDWLALKGGWQGMGRGSWELRDKDFRFQIANCQLRETQGKNGGRLYTGAKGVRLGLIFGKSSDFSG